MKKTPGKKKTEDMPSLDHGFDVMSRFINAIESQVHKIEEDLCYLKQWVALTQKGTPTIMLLKKYVRPIRPE